MMAGSSGSRLARYLCFLAIGISLPLGVLATPAWNTGNGSLIKTLSLYATSWIYTEERIANRVTSQSMAFILMEPAAHSQPITRTLAHLFVSETSLAALNPFVPPALKVKPIVWMALADPLVPQICNPNVLALVHL